MQLVFSLSFVKLLWPFVRITSYAHDQDHVHVHSHAILLHLEDSKYIPHPSTNKTPRCAMFVSLQSYHHVRAMQKEEIKDAYPKKVCHMLRYVKKKIAPYPKKKEKERWCIQRSSYTIHQKYPHTCTSWSWFLTCFSFGSGFDLAKYEKQVCLPYLQLHKNSH